MIVTIRSQNNGVLKFLFHIYNTNMSISFDQFVYILRTYCWVPRNRITLIISKSFIQRCNRGQKSYTKSSVDFMEKNTEASFQHVFLYFQLSWLKERRKEHRWPTRMNFALMTNYLQVTFKKTVTYSVLALSQYCQAGLVIQPYVCILISLV